MASSSTPAFLSSIALSRKHSSSPFTSQSLKIAKPSRFPPARARQIPVTASDANFDKGNSNNHASTTKRDDKFTDSPKPNAFSGLPYFAYFSNMNPNILGPRSRIAQRRTQPHSSKPARLPCHSLVFDVPGPPPEPVFANIVQNNSNEEGICGVLHWISDSAFESVARTELVSVPLFPQIGVVKVVTCILPDGTSVVARTTVIKTSVVSNLFTANLRPSRRYVELGIQGAEFHGVQSSYIDNVLRKIKTDRGPLGAFGFHVPNRPHLLDRPNPYERFGRDSTEMFSPYRLLSPNVAERMDSMAEGEDIVSLRLNRFSIKPRSEYKKKLYYVPGIDGRGGSISGQMKEAEEESMYDISAIHYPHGNRQSMEQLAEEVICLIAKDAGGEPVTIIGESMGGAISLLCASANQARRFRQDSSLDIELLLLINPASSYKRSQFRELWELILSVDISQDVYKNMLPSVLLPLLLDPKSMRHNIRPELLPRLEKLLLSLRSFAEILPQKSLRWRIDLLKSFHMSHEQYKSLSEENGPRKVALIATLNDNMLPSFSELQKLERLIPGLYSMLLPYGGHAPSFDVRFSLSAFLRTFHVTQPAEETKVKQASDKISRRRDSLRKRYASRGEKTLFVSSIRESAQFTEAWESSRKQFSPVFIGEDNVPEYDAAKPVLFVGNHALLGWLDAINPVGRLLTTRGVLVRSMAHPVLFKQGRILIPGGPRINSKELSRHGVVKLSPSSLLEQFAQGNWTLLFPGGAGEALKDPRGEKYKLAWPSSPEFIRACALFGVQIVPISSVGVEDSYVPFLSADQVKSVVETGNSVMRGRIPFEELARDDLRKWRGEKSAMLIPPLPLPVTPDRIYYRFGKAIQVPEECLWDENLEREIYKNAERGVAEGIEILLRRRTKDEFRGLRVRKNFAKRYGKEVEPPAGEAWLWKRNGAYLSEDLQPPI